MPFAETYRAAREIDSEVEAIIEAFETGWKRRAASQKLEERRVDMLLPLLNAVQDCWVDCLNEERRYHRHSFRENLGSIGLWAFIALVGCAPLSALLMYLVFMGGATYKLYALGAIAAIVCGAWFLAPRIPPWNVRDRRARAVTLAAEHLLEHVRANDAARLTELHYAALSQSLDGCTNTRSITYSLALSQAILAALEQVGDGRYVRPVERIAHRERGQLRQAAMSCLPALRLRFEKDAAIRALLRPSRPDVAGDVSLLRPAKERGAQPDQLLRPSEAIENRAA